MKEQHKIASEWMHFAGEDLHAAELLFKEGMYGLACFHAEQCAEKSLKACILYHGSFFRKIHDLNELVETCVECGEE